MQFFNGLYTDLASEKEFYNNVNPEYKKKDNTDSVSEVSSFVGNPACCQECKARKVNCGRVYSVYILKPVIFGRNL